MTYYFSRLTRTNYGIRTAVINDRKGPYDAHRDLWRLMDTEDGPRQFLFSIHNNGRIIYSVSENIPVCNDNTWKVEVKPYDPQIQNGDLFRFYLCANPTVTNSNTGKHQRHDVVMAKKKQLKDAGQDVDMQSIITETVSEWIMKKGKSNGFEIPSPSSLLIHSYQRNEMRSKDRKIVFSSVVIEGILRVTDLESFRNALFKGIGKSKGFGCGMLMIKRS